MARRRFDKRPDMPKGSLNRESLQQAAYIFGYIRPYLGYFIAGLVLLFVGSLVFMIFPYLIGQMVDIAQDKSDLNLDLKQVGLVLIGILVFQGLISYARVLCFAHVSEKGLTDIRKAVFSRLISLSIYFFEENRVGDLISRVTADVEKLYSVFSVTLAEFLRQVTILVVGILLLGITTPRLALIMLGTFPVIVIGAVFFGRYVRRLSRARQDQLAETNTILSEVLQSIDSVKAFANEWYEQLRYGKSISEVVSVSLRFARAIFAVFIITILFGTLFFIIWQGAIMVANGSMTAGTLIAFVTYTMIIGGAIAGLGNFYTQILSALGASQRVRELLFTEPEIEQIVQPPRVQSLTGDIVIENVHYSYSSRPEYKVLDGLSLRIDNGQKVALVGASGAGKSTVIQLLLRFYEVDEGNILLDDKPINSYDMLNYRSDFAIVPQEVILFGGSIRENILYGKPDATEAEIIEAAKKANAWDFISGFPEGLDTIVGERGIKLSGGQRQRIAIARAILRDPVILLLDEATSSLDSESEKQVQSALDRLMENRTSIIIAHRLSTIREVDQIFVLDNGKVAESGTHASLSAIPDGLYNHLSKLQLQSAYE